MIEIIKKHVNESNSYELRDTIYVQNIALHNDITGMMMEPAIFW